MEFRRITNLPPYVFTIINNLKIEARRAGADVIDLGFGNPDIPSPAIAVEKLAEAAQNARNHRYSLSRGIPKLREAVSAMYKRQWDVDLDPETEVTNTIGAKEGFSHLMWVLLDRGDAAIVPSPSYPIHIYGPLFAGADLRQVPMRSLSDPRWREDITGDFMTSLENAWNVGWPKPRVLVMSFPHNPTGATVDLDFMQQVVDFCREKEMIVVHDFAYADVGFDGYRPPSVLQAKGAKECAVELYSMTKSYSMAGWRCAFMVGNSDVVAALVKLKSYLDYGSFQPIQIAATVTLNEASDYPLEVCRVYESRRDHLIDGLARMGWEVPKPRGTMFVWAPIPEPYAEMDSVEFCSHMVRECDIALSPGLGFGPGGEGFVRFALIENEQRIAQGLRNLKRGLVKLDERTSAYGFVAETSRNHPSAGLGSPVISRLVETYVVRVWVPDRPGALGQIASRIGAVHGDVVGIDILERGGGRAIDELVVMLPSDDVVDLLVAEISQVDEAAVEQVRKIDGDRAEPAVMGLEIAARLVEVAPAKRVDCLCNELREFVEADWALAVTVPEGVALVELGDHPPAAWLVAFIEGSRHLPPEEQTATTPHDVAWAHLPAAGLAVAVGRKGVAFRARERRQVALLGRVADSLGC